MKKEQLGELILTASDSMYRVAKTLLENDADCSDAISETIVKSFASLHTLRQDCYAKTWLMRILINECYMIMRREKRMVYLEDYPVEERAVQREDYSDLYQAIRRLPKEIRICVTLYYIEGYRIKEIADLLAVTESTVKNRLARARGRLRSDLEPEVAKA